MAPPNQQLARAEHRLEVLIQRRAVRENPWPRDGTSYSRILSCTTRSWGDRAAAIGGSSPQPPGLDLEGGPDMGDDPELLAELVDADEMALVGERLERLAVGGEQFEGF